MENNAFKDDISSIPGIGDMEVTLTPDESKRSMALMLAIRYHTETIIKDSEYLKTMIAYEEKMKFSNDPEKELWHLKPTTVSAVIHIGNEFYNFITGKPAIIDGKQLKEVELGGRSVQGDK